MSLIRYFRRVHALWLSLVGSRNTTYSKIRSVTHPLLLLYWVFLAVLVHATFGEHSFCPIPSCRTQAMFPSDHCYGAIIGWIWMIQARAGWLFCSKPWLWKGASELCVWIIRFTTISSNHLTTSPCRPMLPTLHHRQLIDWNIFFCLFLAFSFHL